jgi:hypothetical protein
MIIFFINFIDSQVCYQVFCNKCLLRSELRPSTSANLSVDSSIGEASKIGANSELESLRAEIANLKKLIGNNNEVFSEANNHETNSGAFEESRDKSLDAAVDAGLEAAETLQHEALPDASHEESKKAADSRLIKNGFRRVRCSENGRSVANVEHDDWDICPMPRDGHCLFHSLLSILHDRHPTTDVDTNSELREALASYFERSNNVLEVDGYGTFSCESIDCLRSGQDPTGQLRYYGGLDECVAFSYRFSISLEIHMPERAEGFFSCPGGGNSDCAPEVIILTWGWYGNHRRCGTDHWQRMFNRLRSIPNSDAIAVGHNCIVDTNDGDREARVVKVMQYQPRGGRARQAYCYALESHYSSPLGHFFPTQVRLPAIVEISSSADDSDGASAISAAVNDVVPRNKSSGDSGPFSAVADAPDDSASAKSAAVDASQSKAARAQAQQGGKAVPRNKSSGDSGPFSAVADAPNASLQTKLHESFCDTCNVKLGTGQCSACYDYREHPPVLGKRPRANPKNQVNFNNLF